MVSTFTPNINLEEPARGDQVGTWDTPVNNNMTILDLIAGGVTTINAAAGSVVLAAAQYQCNELVILSTLIASITVTFPTSFKKPYSIQNIATGSSLFTITVGTTGGGNVIAVPPGEIVDIINEGNNVRFRNLGRVGSFVDYVGSSVPNWVTACTVPPYLNCDGTAFSSATYPTLAAILGGTTLPDSKGRSRFALDQAAGRISSASGGFSGSGVGASGGGMTTTLGTSNLPAYTPSGTIASTAGNTTAVGNPTTVMRAVGNMTTGPLQYGGTGTGADVSGANITSSFTGTAQGGVSQVMTNLPPAYIGGITMIRAG